MPKMTSKAMREAQAFAEALTSDKAESVCKEVQALRVLGARPHPAGRVVVVRIADGTKRVRRYSMTAKVAAVHDAVEKTRLSDTPHYGVISRVVSLATWAVLERDASMQLRAVYSERGSGAMEEDVLKKVAARVERSEKLRKKLVAFTKAVVEAAYACVRSGEPARLELAHRRVAAERNASKWIRQAVEAGVDRETLVTLVDECIVRETMGS